MQNLNRQYSSGKKVSFKTFSKKSNLDYLMKVDILQPNFFHGRFAFVIQGAMFKAPAFTSDRKNKVGEACHPIFSLLTRFSGIY